MTRSKSDDVWKDWLTVTDGARQPYEAPRPARGARVHGGLPAGMAAFAILVIVIALVGFRFVSSTSEGPGTSAVVSAQSSLAKSTTASHPPSVEPSAPT